MSNESKLDLIFTCKVLVNILVYSNYYIIAKQITVLYYEYYLLFCLNLNL